MWCSNCAAQKPQSLFEMKYQTAFKQSHLHARFHLISDPTANVYISNQPVGMCVCLQSLREVASFEISKLYSVTILFQAACKYTAVSSYQNSVYLGESKSDWNIATTDKVLSQQGTHH